MHALEEGLRVADRGEPVPFDNDTHLVAMVAEGDRTALAALYQRWWRPLLAYLLTQTADRTVAEEILQDTMLAVWRYADRYEARSRASTWLFGIARRQAWNRLRRPAPQWVDAEAVAELPTNQPGPEEQVLARERLAQVATAMGRLSPQHREVLILAFDGRLSYQEIAEVLGTPVGTVRSRLSNAKRALLALTELPEPGSEEQL